jgi:tetratricopeptide (TPR) repeat protein
MTKIGLATLAVAAGLTFSRPATAEVDIPEANKAKARQHFKQGKVALEIGRFAVALKEFEAGYKLARLPAFLFNIGQCHRNLSNYEKAIFSYRLYLEKLPNAPNRAAVETLIAELEEKAEEKRRLEAQQATTKVPSYTPEPKEPTIPRPPPPPPTTPWYKQWWFWVPVGIVVSGAAAAGGYYAFRKKDPDMPPSDLGVWDLSR